MANPLRGEINAELDGRTWTLCLTLGALAELEDRLEAPGLSALSQKFAGGDLKATDLQAILYAGLMGGGHTVSFDEVAEMRIEGGIDGYVELAARLLEATFKPAARPDVEASEPGPKPKPPRRKTPSRGRN